MEAMRGSHGPRRPWEGPRGAEIKMDRDKGEIALRRAQRHSDPFATLQPF